MGGVILALSIVLLFLAVVYGYRRLPAGARRSRAFRYFSEMVQGLTVLSARGESAGKQAAEAPSVTDCSCSCFDFTGHRCEYRSNDPRRLCRHLVHEIYENGPLSEPFTDYREELDEAAKRMRGFYPYSQMKSAVINGQKVTLCADDYDENADVYEMAVFVDGKRYVYEPEQGEWKDGRTPEMQDEIERWAEERLIDFQPRSLPEGSIRTVYRGEGRTAYQIRGEITSGGIVRKVRGSMKNDTDLFTVYAGPVDRDEASLEYHVLTGQCTVSPRLLYMERAVRKWLEAEYPNPVEDYLWGGF